MILLKSRDYFSRQGFYVALDVLVPAVVKAGLKLTEIHLAEIFNKPSFKENMLFFPSLLDVLFFTLTTFLPHQNFPLLCTSTKVLFLRGQYMQTIIIYFSEVLIAVCTQNNRDPLNSD